MLQVLNKLNKKSISMLFDINNLLLLLDTNIFNKMQSTQAELLVFMTKLCEN